MLSKISMLSMTRIRYDILAVALVGLAAISLPLINNRSSTNAGADARIGTIDLEKVYNSIDTYKSKLDAIKAVESNLKTQAETQQAAIKDLEAEFDSYLVKDATKRFAETEGFDYVMLDDSIPAVEPSNAKQMLAQISARRFLFAAPSNDITEKLIAMLNLEFKTPAGAASSAAPTTTTPAATPAGAATGG